MKQQDELATKKDLGKVEGRLQNVENGLQKVEERLQNVENGLQKVEEKLSAKIDANSAKIDRVEQTLSTKIDANSAKIDANAAKIDANSGALSRLTSVVLDNQAEIKRMVTRDEFNRRMDEVITGQDKMVHLFMNLDQERVATTARIYRIEGDVQENRTKIQELAAKVAR